ncbi:hypothetical protein CHS0354_042537, partial [Potamilus streckersoni]
MTLSPRQKRVHFQGKQTRVRVCYQKPKPARKQINVCLAFSSTRDQFAGLLHGDLTTI